jgi:hypothetical protein
MRTSKREYKRKINVAALVYFGLIAATVYFKQL